MSSFTVKVEHMVQTAVIVEAETPQEACRQALLALASAEDVGLYVARASARDCIAELESFAVAEFLTDGDRLWEVAGSCEACGVALLDTPVGPGAICEADYVAAGEDGGLDVLLCLACADGEETPA